MRLALAPLFLLYACVAPVQNGGVDVLPGAAERLAVTCRWRHGDVGRDACGAGSERAAARVHRIEKAAEALRGPLAIGRVGDYLLENDEVAFVVDQLGAGTGFAESGGNVVDAADARSRVDELGQLFTYLGLFPRQAVYEHLETGTTGDGTAWIEVRGHELYEAQLVARTRYSLAPGSRALQIATELENRGTAALPPFDLGDAVQWGSAEKIAPGKALGFHGDIEAPFVAGVGRDVAYALVPSSVARDAATATGVEKLAARNGTAWTNATYQSGVGLSPGQKVRYERVFIVAPRGDTAGVVTELAYAAGVAVGGVAFELASVDGAPTRPRRGRVILTTEGRAANGLDPLFVRLPREGEIGGEIPPGHYTAQFEGSGRRSQPVPVDVVAGKVARARLVLTEGARVRITIAEEGHPLPAKVQIFADGEARPLAPPEMAIHGEVDLDVVPGRYRIVASRGPEYALAEATIEARSGAPLTVPLAIRRVVDTARYLGCDFHQHTAWSADSGVSAAERIASNAVEGVECAVQSEHNQVVDFGPIVKELGLGAFFRAIPGDELTTDASRAPFGHANVFPLVPNPADRRGGALPVRDKTAREVFAAARALPGRPLLQVNHPRAGHRIGYFAELHFDRKTGLGTDPGYDPDFDALEVWSGRHASERVEVLRDFFALLDSGRPVTPTANTDTHGVVEQEAGYPRTYVGVGDDDPSHFDVAALVEAVRGRRDVILTNGPFLTLVGEDVRPGALFALGARGRDIVVHVERAPWVDATELTAYVNGVPSGVIPLESPRTTERGALANDVRVHLRRRSREGGAGAPKSRSRDGLASGPKPLALTLELGSDAHVVFVVTGKKPLEPVLFGDPAEILPFAMTSPVWVDVDGDGRALGR